MNKTQNPFQELHHLAAQAVEQLKFNQQKLVLAESCTGGLVAASLVTVPGASNYFCGSAVTYREPTKTAWLGIEPELLKRFTAESQQVTDSMASQILAHTPEATLAVAVTGHLGPGAPTDKDGLVFVSCNNRNRNKTGSATCVHRQLVAKTRTARQVEAAHFVLQTLIAIFPKLVP